jgi:hypothetical protein
MVRPDSSNRMHRISRCPVVLAILVSVIAPGRAAAEVPDTVIATPARVSVFLDGEAIEDSIARRYAERFMWFVTDSASADVVVHLVSNGQRGRYAYIVTGKRMLAGRTDTLAFATEPAGAVRSRMMARTLALGMLPYLARSPSAPELDIAYGGGGRAQPLAITRDPWNRWILDIGVRGAFAIEQNTANQDIAYTAGANRTTEQLRLELATSIKRTASRYTIGDQTISSNTRDYSSATRAVWKIATHWGAGVVAGLSSSSLLNQDEALYTAAALEYNVLPYDEYGRKQVVAQYSVGAEHFRYAEETIYDKTRETLPKHSLNIAYVSNRSWGEVDASILGSQYLTLPDKNRVRAKVKASVLVVSGLSVIGDVSYALIHDQLFLPKSGASPEDVLLKRKQLETGYQYSMWLGLTYAFGSKAPTAPNPRLSHTVR